MMDRKTFFQKTVGAVLVSIPAYSVLGCSSTDDASDPLVNPQANCLDNGTTTTIGGNHGHSLTVSKADVSAAIAKNYSIQGSSGHPHTVSLTPANFESLKTNQAITVASSSDAGHTHAITIQCA